MAAATFNLPFAEQADFLRQKIALPSERWDDIRKSAHDRAFIVAGAMKADLVADLHDAVASAIEGGKSIEWFRQNFDAIVARHGWTGWTGEGSRGGYAWRTRVIYQTNMATSYAAGRWAQLNDPDLVALRPYWRYRHADGVLHPRPLHLAWNGRILPRDHEFWRTHFPPNGWGCHCSVSAASAADYAAAQRGGLAEPPAGWGEISPKTGAPAGIDKGFDYAPGANARRPLQDLIGQKLIRLDGRIGAAMAQALEPALRAERAAAFAEFVDAALAGPPKGALFVAGALKPKWVAAAEDAGIPPATADISVRDEDARHTFRPGKEHPLDLAWYKRLPEHLDSPGVVVLDTTHDQEPAFLLIYRADEGGADKLVVRINYRIKRVGLGNIVQTGKLVTLDDIRAQIGHGYKLVEGSL